MLDLKFCLDCLKEFLSPAAKLDQNSLTANVTLGALLRKNIENLKEKQADYFATITDELKLDTEKDDLWKFCVICLKLLIDLNESNFEKNEMNCYLSIVDEKLIATACEFIISCGIHYNLEENVGFPIEKLSKFGVTIKIEREKCDIATRNERLFICMSQLNRIRNLKREHVSILSIFYSRYLQDIISALIQLCYSPNSYLATKNEFLNWFYDGLIHEVDDTLLVRNLIMTQGFVRFKCPQWFLINTGNLLTRCLMRPNSVLSVIRAVLNEIEAFNSTQDWKKCDAVAQILAKCPRSVSIEKYFEVVAPQIIKLFYIEDKKTSKQLCRVSGSVYSLFAQKWPELTREQITKSLISPFTTQNTLERSINAGELIKLLKSLHLIFASSTEPNWHTLQQLGPFFMHLLFQLMVFAHDLTTCKTTYQICEDILKLYLNLMENNSNEIVKFLASMLKCGILDEACSYCSLSSEFRLENSLTSDSISININQQKIDDTDAVLLSKVEKRCETLSDLILKLNDAKIQMQFMYYLFDGLNESINENAAFVTSSNDNTFIKLEKRIASVEKQFNRKILYFTQISYVFEKVDPELIVQNYSKIIEFCNKILNSLVKLLNSTKDDELNVRSFEEVAQSEQETLTLILTILTVFTSGIIPIDSTIKKELQILLPSLKSIKEMYENTDLSSLADVLYVNIATYGAVKIEATETKPKKLLIEELSADNAPSGHAKFDDILKELSDPLLPVRGHGFIELRKLIESKDEIYIKEKDRIMKILIDGLQNDDSYIYLASINALIALANNDPDKILTILMKEYVSSKKLDETNKLKIGEVLTKCVKNLADLVPHYSQALLNIFLNGAKSDDDFLRASSLSNLGETCKLMGFSLNDNLTEVILCITSILDTDKCLNVQRSAILVLKLLFEGLDRNQFLKIVGDSMLQLYRILKKVLMNSNDDVIRLHAQQAYEYLDELMRNFLFPQQTLRKEIKILGP